MDAGGVDPNWMSGGGKNPEDTPRTPIQGAKKVSSLLLRRCRTANRFIDNRGRRSCPAGQAIRTRDAELVEYMKAPRRRANFTPSGTLSMQGPGRPHDRGPRAITYGQGDRLAFGSMDASIIMPLGIINQRQTTNATVMAVRRQRRVDLSLTWGLQQGALPPRQ